MKLQVLPSPPDGATAPLPASPHAANGRWIALCLALAGLGGWPWLTLTGNVIDPHADGEVGNSTSIASPEERSPALPRFVIRYLSSLDAVDHGRR